MTRGLSFVMSKQEREADDRRRRVKDTALRLLTMMVSITPGDVYTALDHRTPPTISPSNSGNIMALLAREGLLEVSISRSNMDSGDRGARVYSLAPKSRATLPIYKSEAVRPITKEMLMVGRARPRREPYVSQMPTEPYVRPEIDTGVLTHELASALFPKSVNDTANTHRDVAA